MNSDYLYSMTNDIIFKHIFGNEKNARILISLLNALLVREGDRIIEDVTMINPTNLQEFPEDKLTHLDVKARDNAGRQYNIEVQVRLDTAFIPRIIYYNDRLFTEQLGKTDPYSDLKQTITLAIVDFILLDNEDDLHNIYRYLNVKTHKELSELKELHFIELRKYNDDKPRKDQTRFEKWLHALRFKNIYGGADMLPKELLEDDEIGPAMREFQKAIADPKIRNLIEMREKAERDEVSRLAFSFDQGKAQGKVEGKEEGKAETFNLSKQIVDLYFYKQKSMDEISQICNVPFDFVQGIVGGN